MMSRSIENLRDAFSGESQANRRYLAFAQKAEKEGFVQIAKLFRAAAEAETIHAFNHLKIMEEVKSTYENLETAISGETFEFSKMYPEYIKIANVEGNKRASWSFKVANKVEEVHANLYTKAIQAVKSKNDLEITDYFVCSVCGNTVEDEAPDRCPICNAPKKQFFKIS